MQMTRSALPTVVIGTFALAVGCGIAWVDTRPTWDDGGVTAAALQLAGGLAAVLRLRWWLAALLVAGPIAFAECRSAGGACPRRQGPSEMVDQMRDGGLGRS
jgi:hypothetical protein